MAVSRIEERLALYLSIAGIRGYVREYRFAPPRRWRFDFAWPAEQVAVEVEGGTFVAGRHTRGAGFRQDCAKYNAAAIRGWRVLRFDGEMIADGTAVRTIEQILGGR